jgi:transposase
MFAVEFVLRREQNPDGSITETTVMMTSRKTYPQNWSAYNTAQTNELHEFQALLYDLCQTIPTPETPRRRGRPRLALPDAVFSAVYKVYSTKSSRRVSGHLKEATQQGYIDHFPQFNTVLGCLENPDITPILHDLIVQSSLPLGAVESVFAPDSTGFATSRFTKYHDIKYRGAKEHDWVKTHIMCGVTTHIVTEVVILDRDASDPLQLPKLLHTTAQNFNVREVVADKAYNTVKNQKAVAEIGANAYIPFKSNATGSRGGLWRKAYHYYMLYREEFLQHYHQRSNVETTFMMIKSKFGDSVRSKGRDNGDNTSQVNEILCKVLCHNIYCLIQSMYELGIQPEFIGYQQQAA